MSKFKTGLDKKIVIPVEKENCNNPSKGIHPALPAD
jgi:hypothetical protein